MCYINLKITLFRVKGTNNGSGLFLVSKKRYLPEAIRNIQREQKKIYSADSMTTVSFKGELSLFLLDYVVEEWCGNVFGQGVHSFLRSFLPSYNCGYLTYFDQTWNIERRKYREDSRLYYIE